MLEEQAITCPYCWETLHIDLDLSGGSAEYTEDCRVCCRPIVVNLKVNQATGRYRVDVRAENE
ncbi:MAG: CPXCG motif-containing cysteine-rich protein [Polycyclovorans sp.]